MAIVLTQIMMLSSVSSALALDVERAVSQSRIVILPID